jgi:hypothetical protein
MRSFRTISEVIPVHLQYSRLMKRMSTQNATLLQAFSSLAKVKGMNE